jgi:hypothetical protein
MGDRSVWLISGFVCPVSPGAPYGARTFRNRAQAPLQALGEADPYRFPLTPRDGWCELLGRCLLHIRVANGQI